MFNYSYIKATDTLLINDETVQFYNCPRAKEIILKNAKEIKAHTFSECSCIEKIVLPEGLKSIGIGAFNNTKIRELTLPKSLTEFEYQGILPQLEKINVDEKNPYFKSVDGVLYNKKMTKLICYPSCKKDKGYILPETVRSIANRAAVGCKYVAKINLSKAKELEEIGEYAFYKSDLLKKVIFPENLRVLKRDCFGECPKLSEVDIPKSLKIIDDHCFVNRENKTVKITLNAPKENYNIIEEYVENEAKHNPGIIFLREKEDYINDLIEGKITFKELNQKAKSEER